MSRSSAKRVSDLDRIDQRDCISSWRSRKPTLRKNPLMWAKRKFRIKLGDLLRPLGMRVTEQVDFGSLRRDIQASHVLDVGVADGTPSLYARFPDAKLDLFEPAKAQHSDRRTAGYFQKERTTSLCSLGGKERFWRTQSAGKFERHATACCSSRTRQSSVRTGSCSTTG